MSHPKHSTGIITAVYQFVAKNPGTTPTEVLAFVAKRTGQEATRKLWRAVYAAVWRLRQTGRFEDCARCPRCKRRENRRYSDVPLFTTTRKAVFGGGRRPGMVKEYQVSREFEVTQ